MEKVWIAEVFQDYETKNILGVYKNIEKAIYESKIEMEHLFSPHRGRFLYKGKTFKIESTKLKGNDEDYKVEIIFDEPTKFETFVLVSEYTIK